MRIVRHTSVAVLAAATIAAGPVQAQQPSADDLKKQLDALVEAIKVLQKDVQEIKTLVQRPAAVAAPAAASGVNLVFDLANRHAKGSADAPLTLVEFTDYQCPFCARHLRDTWPQIEEQYVKTGKIRYVMLDLPLESIHKLAFKAAEAANCAGDQGKFWEMHDRLLLNQSALEPWSAHAQALNLNVANFDACMTSGKFADAIRRDMAEARRAGITGTPGFFLARRDGTTGGRVRTVTPQKGAQPFNAFKAEIDRLLAASTATK